MHSQGSLILLLDMFIPGLLFVLTIPATTAALRISWFLTYCFSAYTVWMGCLGEHFSHMHGSGSRGVSSPGAYQEPQNPYLQLPSTPGWAVSPSGFCSSPFPDIPVYTCLRFCLVGKPS